MIRQRGINTLVNEVYNLKSSADPQALVKIFECQISRFVKELLGDPVEKIREKTIRLIENYLRLVSQDN